MVDSNNNPRIHLFDREGNSITQFDQPGSDRSKLVVSELFRVDTLVNRAPNKKSIFTIYNCRKFINLTYIYSMNTKKIDPQLSNTNMTTKKS